MSFVLWLGSFLLGRGKAMAGGIASAGLLAIAGLLAAFFVRGCVLDSRIENLTTERDNALRDLGSCEQVNEQNASKIEEINKQAASNARAAELARVRADQAARTLAEQQEQANAQHEAELDALRAALVSDECADRFVPADVAGLYREAAPRQD